MDEIVDLVDPTVDGLSILVEGRDLLDDLSAGAAKAVPNLILRSNSPCEIAMIAFNGQHAVQRVRNLLLPLTTRLWACWGQ